VGGLLQAGIVCLFYSRQGTQGSQREGSEISWRSLADHHALLGQVVVIGGDACKNTNLHKYNFA